MSSLTTLARPYAKAAFEVARGEDALSTWDEMLHLASAMAGSPDVADLLDHPHVAPARVIEAMAEAAGEHFSASFRRFLDVLGENRRLGLLGEITALYHRLRLEAEKRLHVRVVSAIELNDEQAERMRVALAKRFEKDIDIANEVDPHVLGGAVIYAGDEVIDGSLRGRLTRLSSSLSN